MKIVEVKLGLKCNYVLCLVLYVAIHHLTRLTIKFDMHTKSLITIMMKNEFSKVKY